MKKESNKNSNKKNIRNAKSSTRVGKKSKRATSQRKVTETSKQKSPQVMLEMTSVDSAINNLSTATDLEILESFTKSWKMFQSENDSKIYVSHQSGTRYETYSIDSDDMKDFLKEKFYDVKKSTPSESSIQGIIDRLRMRTKKQGAKGKCFIRVATMDESIYIDLADTDGNMVVIDKKGWRKHVNTSIPFIRSTSMKSLVPPKRGGSWDSFRSFFNVRDENDAVIMLSFILECLRSNMVKPFLCLTGGAGTGKTTLVNMLQELVDPRTDNEQNLPNTIRDLAVFAYDAWLPSFGNISKISSVMSDALCRLSTGGGFRTRKLYSDTENIVLKLQRPVILNGINDFVEKQDLLDRCLFIQTVPFEDEQRKSESDLCREFRDKLPLLLGFIYDAMSKALWNLDKVKPDFKSRMMDFIRLGCAIEKGLKWSKGKFRTAFESNREDSINSNLEDDGVVTAIRCFMAKTKKWQGSTTDLLNKFSTLKSVSQTPIPATSKGLSEHLKRIAPLIKELGYNITLPSRVTWDKKNNRSIRQVTIIKE